MLHDVHQYGKLGSQHVDAIKDGLTAQNIPFKPKDGIRKLTKCLLQKHILNQQLICLTLQNPGVDDKVYDNDVKKIQYFTPVTDINNF
jgi:hypothetical protein